MHYYARIRHRGSNGDISNWSKTADFNTGLVIETPTITVTSPTQLQPIIQSSQFVGVRTHTRTDWEIATDYLFTNVVESSYDDPVNLTQFTPSNLSFDTLYYVRARYKDNLGSLSEYSSATSFYTDTQTNVNPKIDRPQILSPVNTATGVSIQPTISASGFVGTNNATHVSSTWEIAFTPTFGSDSTQPLVDMLRHLHRLVTPVVWCLHRQMILTTKPLLLSALD